nr:hypothetical protein [uncultured Marvinbryantia sp.]
MDRNLIAGTAHELYGQGKSPKQIAAVLHTSVQTAYELTRDIPKGELNDNGLTSKLQVMADFPVRWIDAINPIRRYYGHEPMVLVCNDRTTGKCRKMKKSRHKTKMTKLVLERPGKG